MGKQKLHEVTWQPRSLGSFAFGKAWIGGQESAFKKETRKEPYQPNCHKVFTFTQEDVVYS